MKPLDINTVTRLFGVSRSTIYNKVKAGELSRRNDKRFDFVELVRVFGEPSEDKTTLSDDDLSKFIQNRQASNLDKIGQNERLQFEARVRELEENLHEAKEREAWLKQEFEKLTDTMKLLNPPVEPQKTAPIPDKGFWARLRGR